MLQTKWNEAHALQVLCELVVRSAPSSNRWVEPRLLFVKQGLRAQGQSVLESGGCRAQLQPLPHPNRSYMQRLGKIVRVTSGMLCAPWCFPSACPNCWKHEVVGPMRTYEQRHFMRTRKCATFVWNTSKKEIRAWKTWEETVSISLNSLSWSTSKVRGAPEKRGGKLS